MKVHFFRVKIRSVQVAMVSVHGCGSLEVITLLLLQKWNFGTQSGVPFASRIAEQYIPSVFPTL
jgi:hypothetical protein